MAAQEDPEKLYLVGLNTTRLLMMVGDLVIGWLLLRQAEVAYATLEKEEPFAKDQFFYEGKIGAARWFAQNRLIGLSAERAVVEATTGQVMDMPDEAF